MTRPRASVIVPVRGRLALTRRCLDSVRARTPLSHELVVVDNASGPAVRRYLAGLARAKAIRLIRNERNASFAASINQGSRLARGKILVWLNNDAVVAPEWLERLEDCLRRHPRAAAAGPCTNDPESGSGRGARHAPRAADLARFAAAWSLRFNRQAEDVPLLSGFCLALRREAWTAVGPLDERFLWGEEDADYCFRLRQAGYALVLARDAFVLHDGGATRGRWGPARKRALHERNRELLRSKWEGVGGAVGRDALAVVEAMR
jgi:GT2 family glycosyltransferase